MEKQINESLGQLYDYVEKSKESIETKLESKIQSGIRPPRGDYNLWRNPDILNCRDKGLVQRAVNAAQNSYGNRYIQKLMANKKGESFPSANGISDKKSIIKRDFNNLFKKNERKNIHKIKPVKLPTTLFCWDTRKRHGFRPGVDIPDWYRENPNCPWNGEAINYLDEAPTFRSSTDGSVTLAPINIGGFQEPLGAINKRSGEVHDLPLTSTVEKANRAIDKLQEVANQSVFTYNATTAAVNNYINAKKDVSEGGEFGPAPAGVNWQAPPGDTEISVGELAEYQTPHGGTVSIGELFREEQNGKKNIIQYKTVDAAKGESVSRALETARGKDNLVKNSIDAYYQYITNVIPKATRGIRTAYDRLTMQETEEEQEKALEKKSRLETEKAEAKAIISQAETMMNKGPKLLAGDKADG